jgi:serine/threonine protein kinase
MRVCPSCQSRYLGDDPFCSKDGQPTIEADPNIRFDPLLGSNVGNYKITVLLGEGGMGAVYKAEHPSIGRTVAIKVLRGEYAYRQDTIERFFNEARSVNQIRHENIVDIIDFGLLPDQRPYFIMEYLEGIDLDGHLRKRGATSLTEALDIMMPVLSALQAAHDEGIIHRDLKPENIFLFERKHGGRVVKLLDFGIAKLLDAKEQFHKTNTGSIIGTPAYMSPEQAAGNKNIDHRADVYAAGIILYELLVGEPPFDGETALEIVHKQWKEKPPSPRKKRSDLPEDFELIIYAALEKDRDKRIQSASQFASRLKAAITKVNISHAKPPNKIMAAPEVKLPSGSGVSGLRAALQSKKELTPPPPKEAVNPQIPKKEPTPQPPGSQGLFGGYPLLKPSSTPGAASLKSNSPTPDKSSRPPFFGKSGDWSVLKSNPGKLPDPVKEAPSQSLQKGPNPFKRPSIYKKEQATESILPSALPADSLAPLDRSEETRVVSNLSGGSFDELRSEATQMAPGLSSGPQEAPQNPAARSLPSNPKDVASPRELLTPTNLAALLSEDSAEMLRNEVTRMAAEPLGGSLDLLRSAQEQLAIAPLEAAESTRLGSVISGGSIEALQHNELLHDEPTRMASDLSGGSLDELRRAEAELEAPNHVNDQDESTVVGSSSMNDELAAAISAEHNAYQNNLFGEAPDLLGEESTQNNILAPVRDLEEAPPVSEYEEPSIMKEFPRNEDISSAHTSILDYDNIPATSLLGPPNNTAAVPESPAAIPAERPRRETPPISGEVALSTKASKKVAQSSILLLVFVVLAVLSGVIAVLIRQFGSSSAQIVTLVPNPILPQSQEITPITNPTPPPEKPVVKPKENKTKKRTESKPK